jgi:hypothetical protein
MHWLGFAIASSFLILALMLPAVVGFIRIGYQIKNSLRKSGNYTLKGLKPLLLNSVFDLTLGLLLTVLASYVFRAPTTSN